MTYEEMMAKLGKGEPLTKEEFEEMGKITRPTERFNKVSGDKQKLADQLKEAQEKVAVLEAEKVKLGQEAEDKASEKLKELSGQIETLTGENTQLKAFKETATRLNKVRGIANNKKYNDGATFRDAEYLEMLLTRKGVDLDNEEAIKTAMTELKEEKPEQFVVPVTSGSGTGSTPPNTGSKPPLTFKTFDDKVAYMATHAYDDCKDAKITN